MSKKRFVAGVGANFGDDKAQVYGEFLWKLKESNGETLSPEYVVQNATPKTSPIHDYFEWDDKVAGGKYRTWQARYLLGRIEIVIEEDGKGETTRAFHNISIKNQKDENERGYVTLTDVKNNADYLQIVLENALDEIKSWQKRYSQYKRIAKFRIFNPLFKEIKNIEKRIAA